MYSYDAERIAEIEETKKIHTDLLMALPRSGGIEDSIWNPKNRGLKKVTKSTNMTSLLKENSKQELESNNKEPMKDPPDNYVPPHMRGLAVPQEDSFAPTTHYVPPHMRGVTASQEKSFTSSTLRAGTRPSRVTSDASTASGSVLYMAEQTTHRPAFQDCGSEEYDIIPDQYSPPEQSEALNASDSWVDISKDFMQEALVIKVAKHATKPGGLIGTDQVSHPSCTVWTSDAIQSKKIEPDTGLKSTASDKNVAAEVIAKGSLFAKNAGNKYGVPKWLTSKKTPITSAETTPTKSYTSREESLGQNVTRDTKPVFELTISGGNGNTQFTHVPSKTAEATASITASAGPATSSGPFNLTSSGGPAATKSENLEHAVYFEAWGKPIERDVQPAQKRKVIITGDPGWQSTPKPDFIASLVFGGPVEQILCGGNSAAVTFINPADAQAFFDATPNGIVYRKTSEQHHYAEIRMAEDVSPVSSLVTQYVGVGATRCVKATGVDVAMSLEYLTALGNGRLTSRGTTPRTLERLVDDMNSSGYRVVTFRFCDIRHAVHFKGEVSRLEDWEEVNFQYAADPCAEATGPRVEIRPVTRAF